MKAIVCIGLIAVSVRISSPTDAQPAPWPPESGAIAERFPGRDPDLIALLDEHVLGTLEHDPVGTARSLGDFRFNDRLGDKSPEAYAEWRAQLADRLSRLERMDTSGFTEEDLLDAELLGYTLSLALERAEFHPEHMPVASIRGPQYWGPQLGRFVPMLNDQHRADYCTRLESYPAYIDQSIGQMRAGMAAGRVPPKVVVEPAVAQAKAQASEAILADPAQSPFFSPFKNESDSAHADRARKAIEDGIVPAYQRLALFLETEYIPACRDTYGDSAGVDGLVHYELELLAHTTLPLTADEIHEIGLVEVARIRHEMFAAIARSDFPDMGSFEPGSDELFAAFTAYLRTDDRFYFDTEDELLDAYRSFAKKIDPELIKLFGRLPRLPYGVSPIPEFAAKHSPTAYYYGGSIESGTAGYFMANTYDLRARPKFDIVPLTLHESVPGHHLQNALDQELESAHPFRKMIGFTAYGEGWALYCERLGLEMGDDPEFGFYADPYDDFGRLNYEIWRAMRLVVDTGVHAKGWTRDQIIEYMRVNSAATELDIISETDRYIGWPGQACAYKIGEMKIRAIRAEAEAALGDEFDIRAFHDHLLGAGPMPLPMLERRMERWITDRSR